MSNLMRIRADEAKRIDPVLSTAWIVKLPAGKMHIEVWGRDATIEAVHESLKRRFEEFQVTALGVGSGTLTLESKGQWHEDQLYMPDSRYIDQDGYIQI